MLVESEVLEPTIRMAQRVAKPVVAMLNPAVAAVLNLAVVAVLNPAAVTVKPVVMVLLRKVPTPNRRVQILVPYKRRHSVKNVRVTREKKTCIIY
jgi:hypothetical protein